MTDNDNHTVALADLSVQKVRDENPQVAEALQAKEDRIDELQDEKADLKADVREREDDVESLEAEIEELEASLDEKADDVREEYEEEIEELEEELATKTEIIEEIRESERAELLNQIREARAAINGTDPEEVEVAEEFDDASNAQLQATADALMEAAEAVSGRTQSASSEPEDINPETAQTEVDETKKMQVAEEMGVADQLKKADELSPQGFQVDPN